MRYALTRRRIGEIHLTSTFVWDSPSPPSTPGLSTRETRHVTNHESAFQLEMSRSSSIYRVRGFRVGICVTLPVTSPQEKQFARREEIYVSRDCFGILGVTRKRSGRMERQRQNELLNSIFFK